MRRNFLFKPELKVIVIGSEDVDIRGMINSFVKSDDVEVDQRQMDIVIDGNIKLSTLTCTMQVAEAKFLDSGLDLFVFTFQGDLTNVKYIKYEDHLVLIAVDGKEHNCLEEVSRIIAEVDVNNADSKTLTKFLFISDESKLSDFLDDTSLKEHFDHYQSFKPESAADLFRSAVEIANHKFQVQANTDVEAMVANCLSCLPNLWNTSNQATYTSCHSF